MFRSVQSRLLPQCIALVKQSPSIYVGDLLARSLVRVFPYASSLDIRTGQPLSTIRQIKTSREAISMPNSQRVSPLPSNLEERIRVVFAVSNEL